tara:strand:+ start:572 stop:1717 length:1146 start_codon:yes stop_codon:yes gene_type:complete
MNAILRLFQAIFSKGSQLFGLRSVVDKFFNKNKEGANNIVKTDFNKDRFVERFFGPDSASSPSDDASDVFTPDPLVGLGGGTILPLDTVVPNIDSTPLQDSSLSSIVNQINKINANIDAIRDAMLQSSVIEAGYRQKLIEDLEQKLADRGGERSGRRNERRKFNFLRNAARKFIQTKNTIAKNPFLSAAVGGIGLEILGNLVDRNKNNKANSSGSGNGDPKSASMPSSSNMNLAFNQNGRKLPNFGFSGPLSASTQPVSGMFNETNSFQDDVIDNSMTDIVDNLSLINEIMMPGSGSETTNISSSFGNKNFSSNMSLVGSASRFPVPVGSKSGITVLDLRTKSSDQPGNDISKSVPVFGSDVTSSEPSMGDWEIYLSKGRI